MSPPSTGVCDDSEPRPVRVLRFEERASPPPALRPTPDRTLASPTRPTATGPLRWREGPAQLPAAELQEFLRCAEQVGREMEKGSESANAAGHTAKLLQAWDRLTAAMTETGGRKLQTGAYFAWSIVSLFGMATRALVLVSGSPGTTGALGTDQMRALLRGCAVALSLINGVPAGIHLGCMLRDGLRNHETSRKARLTAIDSLEGALRRMEDSGSLQDAAARASFLAACRKLPELSEAAQQDRWRANASLIRDCILLPMQFGLSALMQAGTALGWSQEARNALLLTWSLVLLAQSACNVVQGGVAERTRADDLLAGAASRKSAARQFQLRDSTDDDGLRELQAITVGFLAGQSDLQQAQLREKAGGLWRLGDGLQKLVLGGASAMAGVLNLHRAGSLPDAAGMAGVAASALGSLYYQGTAWKFVGRVGTSLRMEHDQAQAQVLILDRSRESLVQWMLAPDTGTIDIPDGPYNERGGFRLHSQEVSAGARRFVGLHLAAVALQAAIEDGNARALRDLCSWLRQVAKMPQYALDDLIDCALMTAPARRLAFFKQGLSPLFAVQYACEADGAEAAPPAPLVAQRVLETCRTNGITLADVTGQQKAALTWRRLQTRLRPQIGSELLVASVNEIARHVIRDGGATRAAQDWRLLQKLAKAASKEKASSLGTLAPMSKQDQVALAQSVKLRADDFREFTGLVKRYAAIEPADRIGRKAVLDQLSACRLVKKVRARPDALSALSCGPALLSLLDHVDIPAKSSVRAGRANLPADHGSVGSTAHEEQVHSPQRDGQRSPEAMSPVREDEIRIDITAARNPRREAMQRIETRRQLKEQAEILQGGREPLSRLLDAGNTAQD